MSKLIPFLHKNRISSLYLKYFVSYVFFAIVLLILVGGILYSSFFSTLRTEIENAGMINLSQIKETMDTKLSEMEQITLQLSSNPKFTPGIMRIGGYNYMEAVNELRKLQLANSFIYDIIVFYRNGDSGNFCAASGIYDMNTFFNYMYKYENWDEKNFLQTVDTLKTPSMRPVEPLKLYGKHNEKFATYMYPIYPNSSNVSTVVMFLIEEKSFIKMVEEILKSYSGYVYFLNQYDTPVFSIAVKDEPVKTIVTDDMLTNLDIASLKFKSVQNLSLNQKQYSVIADISEYNKWSYIAVLPTDQYMKKLYASRDIFIKSLLCVLILGFVISYVLSSRSYKPIQKLANILNRNSGSELIAESVKRRDEISLIENTIYEIKRENQNLLYQLKSSKSYVKTQVLINLLKGRYKSREEIDLVLQDSEIKFQSDHFAVLVFLIDDIENFRKENKRSIQEIIKYGIVNVLEELSSENHGYGFGIDMGKEDTIALLLTMHSDIDYETYMDNISKKATNFFKNYYNFTMTVGAGNVYDDLLMVNKSYEEAETAASYRFMYGRESLIFYRKIQIDSNSMKWYPFGEEQQLISLLKQGKLSELELHISDIFQQMHTMNLSPDAARWICYNLTGSIKRAVEEINLCLSSTSLKKLDEILLFKFETIWDVKHEIVELCSDICNFAASIKESKNFRLRDQIIEYIHENYTDHNLSLKVIASYYNLSPSYLTRYFKDQMGDSLMQYIDNLRMENAKKLLESTSIPLSEVIDHVGYIDKANFIRKFKKLYGSAPIQFRNNRQEADSNSRSASETNSYIKKEEVRID